MRLAFTASALCLSILVFAAQQATSQTPVPSSATPASAATAGDAAAKHAKRTACLKETKARKLLGAEKTAFLKDCIDAPPEAISASRISPPDRP
jgi:acyl-CoA synthetase (NDP forming)